MCIKKNQVCDLTDDCGDNSDELADCENSYLQTTFEQTSNPLGYFEWSPPSNFEWQRRSGELANPGTGATIDHTTLDNSGHYMFINSSQEVIEGERADLVSKPFKKGSGDDGDCEVIFYYHMHGPNVGSLKVSVVSGPDGEMIKLWEKSGDQQNMWLRDIVKVNSTSMNHQYSVVFTASIGGKDGGDIALDDVVFSNNCKLLDDDSATTTTTTQSQGLTNCDFEVGLCGWEADLELNNTARFQFERRTGQMNQPILRPTEDHNGEPGGNIKSQK